MFKMNEYVTHVTYYVTFKSTINRLISTVKNIFKREKSVLLNILHKCH